jgi:hypothetical protein
MRVAPQYQHRARTAAAINALLEATNTDIRCSLKIGKRAISFT